MSLSMVLFMVSVACSVWPQNLVASTVLYIRYMERSHLEQDDDNMEDGEIYAFSRSGNRSVRHVSGYMINWIIELMETKYYRMRLPVKLRVVMPCTR